MKPSTEKTDLLTMLADQRKKFLYTVSGITDDQARQRTTVSELTLGGLLNHVVENERSWMKIIAEKDEHAQFDMSRIDTEYTLGPEHTVSELLDEYKRVAARTEAALAVMDLDEQIPLPTAPWSPERRWQSARFTVLHVLREIAQHAGHADIIRESLDGANSTRQMAVEAGMDLD